MVDASERSNEAQSLRQSRPYNTARYQTEFEQSLAWPSLQQTGKVSKRAFKRGMLQEMSVAFCCGNSAVYAFGHAERRPGASVEGCGGQLSYTYFRVYM